MRIKICQALDHVYNPVTLDGKCVECGGVDQVTEPQHTKTPWILYDDGHDEDASDIIQAPDEDQENPEEKIDIAEMFPAKNQHANAAFIVRAANSHKALLAGIKHARQCRINNENECDGCYAVKLAIAQAEGK